MINKLLFVLLNPKGRIRKDQFWWAWILILILGIGLKDARNSLGQLFFLITYLYLTVTIYGKRLHDIGKSAWKLTWPMGIHASIMILTVFAGQIAFSGYVPFDKIGLVFSMLGLAPAIVWLVFAFMVGLPQGEVGDNRFGPDPRQQLIYATAPSSTEDT